MKWGRKGNKNFKKLEKKKLDIIKDFRANQWGVKRELICLV
jgi:hypothetical protein